MPRDVQLGLPEFAAESSVAYFKAKKEAFLEASFEQLLQETPRYLAQAQEALRALDGLIAPNAGYANGTHLSMEDILVFPLLRNLSMVKGMDLSRQCGALCAYHVAGDQNPAVF